MSAHFGLDIGSYSIKVAQIEKKGKGYKLAAIGEVRTPVNIVSQSEVDKRALATSIKKLVAEAKIGAKEAVLSLSESSVYTQVIELPYLSQTELASAISYEAEQYIPVPINEVKLEYIVLSTFSKGLREKKMEVLLVAARKYAIDRIVLITELAGFTPIALETEILSLVRVINFSLDKDCLILDLGNASTNIVILQDQKLKLVRTLNTAGEAFTRSVAQDLSMEFLQAEQYKTTYGLNKNVLEGKVAKAIIPIFEVILTEVRKALNFFLQKQPEAEIGTLVVAGGGAAMPGVSSFLAQALNLEVIMLDPLKNFTQESKLEKLKNRERFSTAIGLAMREE